jgi:hypothetical protein
MRTKTLLLTAAMVAAGALSSMAQNVYSVNVVGYVNVTLQPGYNLIANQLDNSANGGNGITLVLTNETPTIADGSADGSTVFKWNPGTQQFTANDTYYSFLGGWVDNGFSPSTTTVAPGEAFFFQNLKASPITLTLVGTVLQGTNTNNINSAYGFFSDFAPVVNGFSTNGFPNWSSGAWDGSTFQTFAAGQYSGALTYFSFLGGWVDSGFSPADPSPAVGQGFLIFNTGVAAPWVRTFKVQ